VRGSASGVAGRIEWRNAEGADMGERRFLAENGDCTKLLTEMTFAVGLQIELLRPKPSTETAASSSRGATNSSTSPAPAATPPPVTTAPAVTTAPVVTTTPATALDVSKNPATPDRGAPEPAASPQFVPWRFWVGVGPSLAWGLSPALTLQGRVFFGVRRKDVSLELGAEGTVPVTDPQPGGSGFRQSLLGASASVCGYRGILAACLLGKASQLRVRGLGVDAPLSPTALVAQLGLRLAATWEVSGPWTLTPHLDALGLLTPRTVTLNQVEVWTLPRASVLVGIDVAVRFR
jgi:hypothetical protein